METLFDIKKMLSIYFFLYMKIVASIQKSFQRIIDELLQILFEDVEFFRNNLKGFSKFCQRKDFDYENGICIII